MTENTNSAVARDLKHIRAAPTPMGQLLVTAAREIGVNPIRIGMDYRKIKRGVGSLRFDEYYLYDLHDRTKLSDDERSRFVSAYIHWQVFSEVMSREWWKVTEDKWVSGSLLEAAGQPTPETVAVIDPSRRLYPGTQRIASNDDLVVFLKTIKFPIFAKAINSMWSAGSFVIDGVDGDQILIKN